MTEMTVTEPMSGLDVTVAVEPQFDFLSDEYRALYAQAAATAFQAPLWMHRVNTRLAPAKGARPYTVTIRNRSDNALLAVFPLALQKTVAATLVVAADFGVCDYNAPVATVQFLELLAASPAVLDKLDGLLRVEDLLLYRKVRSDGFDVGRIFRAATFKPAENPAYHCDIGDDFQAWRRGRLRKKFTKELNRKERQFTNLYGAWTIATATRPDEIDAAFVFIRHARRDRYADEILHQDDYYEFYRDYARAAIPAGEAQLMTIRHDDEPIAALFGLTGDGDFHATLIGGDLERFGRFSPGIQVVYRTIEARFAEGHTVFDLGPGNTGYKSHFSAEETELRNFSVANTLIGSSVALVYHHARPLKNALKKAVPYVR